MSEFSDQKQLILVIDDTPENIDILVNILKPYYRIKAATHGKKAINIALSDPKPDMILLDIMMPDLDGYDVIWQLKNNPITKQIPVIFITTCSEHEDEEKGLKMGAVDYITKPISPQIVLARVKTHLALYHQNLELETLVNLQTKELRESRFSVIQHLAKAAEFKDTDTHLHVIRMSHYCRLLAKYLNTDKEWQELLYNAAPMHDVGKIGIPDHILLKPGKLDTQEWKIMQQHTTIGADILSNDPSSLIVLAREIALYHHEKWDGTGYPHQLKREEIPLSARIVALADVFDALVSKRPYKKAWDTDAAVEFILEQSGIHFDPKIVQIFQTHLDQFLELKEQFT